MDDPVWVRAVQIGILVDHFGLDPDAEFHAERLNPLGQAGQTTRQALWIGGPVAQTGGIARARAEPAVIQHEELNAVLVRCTRDVDQLILVEIEVGGFPVVDQNRARLVTPFSACQPAAVQAVIGLAERI